MFGSEETCCQNTPLLLVLFVQSHPEIFGYLI